MGSAAPYAPLRHALGGFVGPYTVGIMWQKTGNSHYGLICAGVFFLVSASLALVLPKRALPAPDQPSGAADIVFETGVTGCTTVSVPSEIPMRKFPVCRPRHTFSRMATATGQFWTMEKSAPCIQVMRFACSVLWKAEARDSELSADNLTLDRTMAIFTADLRRRSVDVHAPSDPLADTAWILLLQRIYADSTDSRGKQ
jgi:hypothetical protein